MSSCPLSFLLHKTHTHTSPDAGVKFHIYFHPYTSTLDVLLGQDTIFSPFGRLRQVLHDRKVKFDFVWFFLKFSIIKGNVLIFFFLFFCSCSFKISFRVAHFILVDVRKYV